MKMIQFLFLFLFLTCQTLYAFEYEIVMVRGQVKLEGNGTVLKVNDKLRVEDIVSTGDHSFARIKEPNGGLISLGANSSVKLSKDKIEKISSIGLLKGQVRALFDKKQNPKYKFYISTKSASMGVRGTDFHVIYNPENNVSTVLTYEGNVEFKENHSNGDLDTEKFIKQNKVSIPPGSISGVFYNEAKATPPIKISPVQFNILKSNQDLIEGTGQKVTHSKESVSLAANNDAQNDPIKANDIIVKDSNIIPVPKKFLIDEYFEDKITGNPVIKGGGYIDLKTGIYIHPPENSAYDAQNDIYYPPIEFGGIDEESGEYVSPPGLILSPLKGFMFTTDVIQKGFHTVSSTVSNVVTPVTDTVTNVGGKTIDTIKGAATMLRENTGPIGTTVGAGVDLVETGINTTLDIAQDSSSLILNQTANTLNYVLHENFLSKLKVLKEHTPLLNFFRIKLVQTFNLNHVNTDKFNMFDQNIERESSVSSVTSLDLKFQKSIYTKFFVRPKIEIKNTDYFGSNGNLKSFDNTQFYYGSDFGYSTDLQKMKYQTYFSIEKGYRKKALQNSNDNIKNEDSWRFGFNKLILGQKMFSTTFAYTFENYHNVFYGNGNRHNVKISEIVSINDKYFARLTADWFRSITDDFGNSTVWSSKLNFYMATLKWNMNLDFWGGLRFLSETGFTQKRKREENYFAGTSLIKSFENNFSVQFSYELLKQTSPDYRFKYVSQNFTTGLEYTF
jgi:hypothetical protein